MSSEILDRIKEAGVVGAGGAGFPTHVKLAAHAETLIINACECEPLIRVDQQLLLSHTNEFLGGLDLALQQTGARKCYIAIKAKHTEVVSALKARTADSEIIEIAEIGDYYPAGDEQILVYDVLGKVVPLGGIPLAVGCVVCNVETIINIHRAVQSLPVITTFVTINGAIPTPATFELPVGISYREALSLCGVTDTSNKAAFDGGPMMGKLVLDLDAPIGKTTKAILLFDAEKGLVTKASMTEGQVLRQSKAACEQCQKCTDLCPRDLLGHQVKPHLLMRIVNYGLADFGGMKRALGCCECGACELYACPCGLSPRRVNALVKQQLLEAGVRIESDGADFRASSMIAYRKIPVKRLIARLGLSSHDHPAPLKATDYEPTKVSLLLKQHLGAPATSVVNPGDTVTRGQQIAHMQDDKLGAAVHASIDGVVSAISNTSIVLTKH